MRQIAEEVGAEYQSDPQKIYYGKTFAYAGDWAVKHPVGGGVTFFGHEAFLRKFRTHSERVVEDERYAKVFGLVQKAMIAQESATYHGDNIGEMEIVAIKTTMELLGEL
jgi:hypothetical protein